MQITYKKLKDIRPYEKNPRNNDAAVDKVVNSIKEFGFKSPIIIDKNGVIVAGHTRYKASQKLGLKEVPCIEANDLTENQIKAYRLADNKTAEFAEWDFSLLDDELDDLKNIPDLDMQDFGFYIDDSISFDEIFVPNQQQEKLEKKEPVQRIEEHENQEQDNTDTETISEPDSMQEPESSNETEQNRNEDVMYIVTVSFNREHDANELAERLEKEGFSCKVGVA